MYRIFSKMTTSDRNENLTLQQLIDKIKDELFIRAGRVNNLSDLAKDLNVDLDQLKLSVSEIVREKEMQLVQESLIAHYYIQEIAQEIHLKLQTQGVISVDDLTQQFDLPADVLQHGVLEKYLGTIINGRQDPSNPKIFYTVEYITRTKAKLRGALMGFLRPTHGWTILKELNIEEGLFINLFKQLNDSGKITGKQNFFWKSYLPLVHIKSQDDWLIRIYKGLNYLNFFHLELLYIPNEIEYVKKILAKEDMIILKGTAMDIKLKHKLEIALQECIASKSFLKVESFLQFELYDEDIETFLVPLLKNYNSSTILFDKTVFSNNFIETLKQACLSMIKKNAMSVVMSGKYQQYLEEQLAKSEELYTNVDKMRCGKEWVTKSNSKPLEKYLRSKQFVQDSESDEAPCSENTSSHFEIISIEDVENAIKKKLRRKQLGHFVTRIAEYIKGCLNQRALAIAEEFAENLFQDALNRKFTHYSTQNRINVLINEINLYEKGLKLFPSDQQPQFIKYLLESFGGDVLSEFCKHAACQCNLSIQADALSVEQRNIIINDLPEEYMKPLHGLNSVLAALNMEQFYQAIDICLSECGMASKKINKKKERLLVHKHREKLLSDLKNCEEPALVIHLVVTAVTRNMLHASSREVPLIIIFLKSQLTEHDFDKVKNYHDTVTKYFTTADEEKECIHEKLKEDVPSLKSIVTNVKKYSRIPT